MNRFATALAVIVLLSGCSSGPGIPLETAAPVELSYVPADKKTFHTVPAGIIVHVLALKRQHGKKYYRIKADRYYGWTAAEQLTNLTAVQAAGVPAVALLNRRLQSRLTAADTDHLEKLLQRGADPNIQVGANKKSGEPLLSAALLSGLTAKAKLLLQYGADPNRPDRIGRPPLSYTVFRVDPVSWQLLQRAGAKLNRADRYGDTPLLLAAEQGNLEMVKWLAGQGAPLDQTNRNGQNAVTIAAGALHGQPQKLLSWLLQRKVPVIRSRTGVTPLHAAAYVWNSDCVRLLLERGEPVDQRNSAGSTPLLSALSGNWFGQREESRLSRTVKLLLEKRASADAVNSSGFTVWHWIALHNRPALLPLFTGSKQFINNRLSPSFTLFPGWTPLMLAAHKGTPQLCRRLIRIGADPALRNSRGERAHDIAVRAGWNRQELEVLRR